MIQTDALEHKTDNITSNESMLVMTTYRAGTVRYVSIHNIISSNSSIRFEHGQTFVQQLVFK